MTLENLPAIHRVVAHEPLRVSITKLLTVAARNIADAKVTSIDSFPRQRGGMGAMPAGQTPPSQPPQLRGNNHKGCAGSHTVTQLLSSLSKNCRSDALGMRKMPFPSAPFAARIAWRATMAEFPMKRLIQGINYSPELTGIGKYSGETKRQPPISVLLSASVVQL